MFRRPSFFHTTPVSSHYEHALRTMPLSDLEKIMSEEIRLLAGFSSEEQENASKIFFTLEPARLNTWFIVMSLSSGLFFSSNFCGT